MLGRLLGELLGEPLDVGAEDVVGILLNELLGETVLGTGHPLPNSAEASE